MDSSRSPLILKILSLFGYLLLVPTCGRVSRTPSEDESGDSNTPNGGTHSAIVEEEPVAPSSGGAPRSVTVPLEDAEAYQPSEQTQWYVGFSDDGEFLGWPLDDAGGVRAPWSLSDPSMPWRFEEIVISPTWEYAAFHGSPMDRDITYLSDIRCRFYVVPLRGIRPQPQEVCFAKEGVAREAAHLSWIDETTALIAFSASDGGDLQWFVHDVQGDSIKLVRNGEDALWVSPSPNGRWLAVAFQDSESLYLMNRIRPDDLMALHPVESPERLAWERSGDALSYIEVNGDFHLLDLRRDPEEITLKELEGPVAVQAWGDSVLALLILSPGSEVADSFRIHLFDLGTLFESAIDIEPPLPQVETLHWSPESQALVVLGRRVDERSRTTLHPLFRFDDPFETTNGSPAHAFLSAEEDDSFSDLDWLADGSIITRRLTRDVNGGVRFAVVRWPALAREGDYELLGDGLFESASELWVSPSGSHLLIGASLRESMGSAVFWRTTDDVLPLPPLYTSGAPLWLPDETGFIVTSADHHYWADLRSGAPEAWIRITPE